MKSLGYKLWIACCSLIVILITNHYSLQPVFAADSTPSADIQAKIDSLKTEIASKAAALKNEVNKKLQNKAFSGVVKLKTDSKITLDSDGKELTILTDQYTDFSSQVKGSSKISTNDFLAALGDEDDSGSLHAKKVIKLPPPKKDTTEYLWGKIQGLNSSGFTLLDKDNKTLSISTTSNTSYQLGKDEASFDNLTVGKYVVVVGSTKGNLVAARFVYIFPTGPIVKTTKKVASQSASASPTATTKKK